MFTDWLNNTILISDWLIQRVAEEFCEDAGHNGLLYVESRFCPHLLLSPDSSDDVTADDVVEAVLRGFKTGEEKFGVTARVLLCCIRGNR